MIQTPITIRRATMDDASTIAEFNRAMALETEGKRLDVDTLQAGVRNALLDRDDCKYFIADVQGKIAGQTMVTLEWSDWRNGYFWWIQSVYVAEAFRRMGVFRCLYHHVRETARREKGVCGLRLYVHHDNERAIRTYQKLGMTVSEYKLCEEDWS